MIKEIEEKGICIESNPSSNLKIGPFNRYDDLPLLRLKGIKAPRKHRVSVSINTDDRGVFSTSIHNEYSLMAIALTKACVEAGERKYSNEEIEKQCPFCSSKLKIWRNTNNHLWIVCEKEGVLLCQ